MFIIGKNKAITINPITIPKTPIMIGSMTLVKPSTAAST